MTLIGTSYYIFTYGCQMNLNDSELIAGILEHKYGCVLCETPDKADFLIFNTCAVRQNAENRVLSRIREFHGRRKKRNPTQKIILAGCIPQYEKENILDKFPYLDLVIGTNSIESIEQLINSSTPNKLCLAEQRDQENSYKDIQRSSRDQAWIPIMYGCNNFCTYCIVPYTRGREISRKKEAILNDLEKLKGSSYEKIMLLGQNVNSYGQGLYDNYNFTDLLEEVCQLEHISKIDFLTSHPKDISNKLIEIIAKNPKIGREIHFPLQAGDNRILEKMNRKYTYEYYVDVVKKLREAIPDVLISSDLIVGFPGETEKQFENTIKAVKELAFHRVITTAYSQRKGTVAASMDEQIPEDLKHERLLRLQAVVRKYVFKKK